VLEQYGDWMDLYRSALLELDPDKLPKRITEARLAVEKRLRELSPGNGDETQLQALADALQNLRVLARGEVRR
jgi:hypothetical protein